MILSITNTEKGRPLSQKYPELSKYGYHDEERDYWGHCGKVIINSIEELISLSKEINRELIVSADHGRKPSIEIYDDWRE